MELRYTAVEAGQHYVFIEADNAASIAVKREDNTKDTEIRNDCGSIVNIGSLEEGETFRIEVKYDEGMMGSIRCHVCTLDDEAWSEAYEIISSSMMTVDDWGDTYIEGTVEAKEAGVLVTSIPYDEGWSLTVDGEEREIDQLVGGAFISVNLSEGTHEISLSFRPPGIIPGALISLLSTALLAAVCIMWGRKERKRQGLLSGTSKEQQAPSEQEPSSQEESDCNKVSADPNPQEEQRAP